jgi:hypothetical protein
MNATRSTLSILAPIALSAIAVGCTMHTPRPPTSPSIPNSTPEVPTPPSSNPSPTPSNPDPAPKG